MFTLHDLFLRSWQPQKATLPGRSEEDRRDTHQQRPVRRLRFRGHCTTTGDHSTTTEACCVQSSTAAETREDERSACWKGNLEVFLKCCLLVHTVT